MNSPRSKKNRRFKDRLKASTPSDFKQKPFESHQERHERRIDRAMRDKAMADEFCVVLGIKFEVKNQNQHWLFWEKKEDPTARVAEWWPSTAKLVFDKRWRRGIHCHTVLQLLNEIALSWGL